MRILHLVGSSDRDRHNIPLIVEQSRSLDAVVLAKDGSAAARAAGDAGLPLVLLRPGQSSAALMSAVDVLTPDLVHLHGALASDAAVPLRIFSNLPLVLHLGYFDVDGEGHPRRELRGMRLDWRGGQICTLIAPRRLAVEIIRASLPRGVNQVMHADVAEITPAWCLGLYRNMLRAAPAAANDLASAGIA